MSTAAPDYSDRRRPAADGAAPVGIRAGVASIYDSSSDPVRGFRAWSPLVIERDCSSFADALADFVCIHCRQHLDHEHIGDCWILSERLISRHRWIARAHLNAVHPLTYPDIAAIWASHRDAFINDLRIYDALDRDLYRSVLPQERKQVDAHWRAEARFRHLNEGWDGRGVPPSQKAVLAEIIVASLKPESKQDVAPKAAFEWWRILRVDPSASFASIRAAYRRIAKYAHPDSGGDRNRWDLVQRAYIAAQEACPV